MESQNIEAVRRMVENSLNAIKAHRFVLDGQKCALSHEQAIRWIMCAGRESRSFPDILTGMIGRSTNPKVIKILRENLDDEYGNGNPERAHFRHYIRLLGKLHLDEHEFLDYKEKAGIRLALDMAYSVARAENSAIALGYMLVNEGMTPITYGAVDTAVHHYYPNLQTQFFRLHVEIDEHHVAELYKAVAAMADVTVNDIIFGVQLGERAMAVLLDEALGIFDTFQATKMQSASAL
jgi:pyrroloquinoline quinone (PQQ) biosynthesis protein C